MRILAFLAFAAASACTPPPMTQERAERQCAEQTGLADGISGAVHVGVGSGGSRSGASITLTKRIFAPQTEEEFISECVDRLLEGKTGTTEVNVSAGRTI